MSMKQQYTENHMVRLSKESDRKLRKKAAKADSRPAVYIREIVEKGLQAEDK